jgi:DNA-binding NarL/FixJ family response regulator
LLSDQVQQASAMPRKILTIGTDLTLVQSRASILGTRYRTVVARPDETMTLLRSEPIDLLLVCYSIPQEEASAIIRTAHQEFPHLFIVRLLTVGHEHIKKPVAHKLVTVNYRPEVWLKAVDELLTPGSRTAFP